MRILTVATLLSGAFAAIPAAEPALPSLAPRTIKWEKPDGTLGEVAAALTKQSGGVPVAVAEELRKKPCDVRLKDTPFWEALQQAADRTGTRIELPDSGRKVALVPRGASKEVAATSGAFRVVAQQVVARALLDQGVTFHEVHLLVHWEPRLRVYRIDTQPKITKALDATNTPLAAESASAQILPTGAKSEMTVKLTGVKKPSDRFNLLAGEFTVTAAEKILPFTFAAPGGKLPAAETKDGVTAALKRVRKQEDTWEIALEVTYPPKQPIFESFQGEWWLRDNRLVLRSPAGKTFPIDDYEIPMPDSPRPLVVIHRFKEDAKIGLGDPTAKGWEIVYETPAPLVEVKVPFELKNIPLP
jgi:hypothetical protein